MEIKQGYNIPSFPFPAKAKASVDFFFKEKNSAEEVMEYQNQAQGGIKNECDDKTNLIINYLPQHMTDKELYSMFVTIGPVQSCRVMKDFKTGYSYGFGFVKYCKEEDASRAIGTLNGLQVQNKRLKVSYARPAGNDIKDTNLYVTNLPKNITEQELDNIFGPYGFIVQKNILKDKVTGMPRGVAFVRYDKKEEAQAAITNLNGVIPDGGTEAIQVKVAEEHGKQKAVYYAGWHAGFSHKGGGAQAIGVNMGVNRGRGGAKLNSNKLQHNRYNPIGGGGGYPPPLFQF